MSRLGCFFGSIVVVAVLAVPVIAAPDATQKDKPGSAGAVHQVSVPHLGLRQELLMLIAGTTLIVVAAVVRRAG